MGILEKSKTGTLSIPEDAERRRPLGADLAI
jgi:hypothetical protein